MEGAPIGHYGDLYESAEREALIRAYGPKLDDDFVPSRHDYEYMYARARSAETELRELKDALRVLRGALR